MRETLAPTNRGAPETGAPRRARFDPFAVLAVAVGPYPDPLTPTSERPGSSNPAIRLLRALAISSAGRYYPHRDGLRRPKATQKDH